MTTVVLPVSDPKASSIIYSIVSTATANGLDVEQYIIRLLTAEELLLPWQPHIPIGSLRRSFLFVQYVRYCTLTNY